MNGNSPAGFAASSPVRRCRRRGARRIAVLAAFAAMAWAAPAAAELSNTPLLGPGLRSRPAYDGSASQHAEVVPVLRFLDQLVFARSTQGLLEGGLRTALAPELHAALQVAYEPGRKSRESALLTRLGVASVGPGASLGAQLEWDHHFGPMPVTLLARARQHLDAHRGAQADLRLSVGVFQSGPVSAGLFVQSTWASAKATASLYGVGAAEAAATGLPAFSAGGGLLSASAGALWSVDLGPQWVVVGSLDVKRLQGDAVRSPLVEKTVNHSASVGLAYRF